MLRNDGSVRAAFTLASADVPYHFPMACSLTRNSVCRSLGMEDGAGSEGPGLPSVLGTPRHGSGVTGALSLTWSSAAWALDVSR